MRRLLVALIALVARVLPTRPAAHPPRRVVVIKPDHLGDLLLASPALASLRQDLPEARITALVGPWGYRLWRNNPALDELVELPFPGFERGAGARNPLEPYLLLARYALLLRRGRYDAALLLRDDHWWGAALAALAGIPVRVGHGHPLCAPLLTVALPYQPREHVTRQALAVVMAVRPPRPLRFHTPGEPPTQFFPSADERAWAADCLTANLAPGERLIVIHPGTGGAAKHWPAANWPVVANALAGRGVRLLLTGGPGEAELVATVAAGLDVAPLTLAGQTSVGQLAALLGRAALVLGVDSGPLHLAVSQGVPSLHLFGPSDQERFGPWGDQQRHIVLRAGLWCSPCGVFAACPRATEGPECMAAITPEEVIAAARRLLEH